MNLNDLLNDKGINPQHVLAFRHRPHEPELNKVLPWLAAVLPIGARCVFLSKGRALGSFSFRCTGLGGE